MDEYWVKATEAERSDALDLLSDVLVQAAVREVGKHRDVPVDIAGVLALPDGDLLVRMRATQSHGRTVAVDWRLRPAGGDLRLVDISIDAVSMIARYREEVLNNIRANGGSIRASIVSLRERVPTTAF